MGRTGWFKESRRHALASRGISTGRKIINAPINRNLKMSPQTYVLRRKIIDTIYEIKTFDPDLPRIEVRITETAPVRIKDGERYQPLAHAWVNKEKLDKKIIWVSEKAVADADVRTIVYHEILHTAYDVPHIEDNKLMKPFIHKSLPADEAKSLYLELKNKYQKR